MTTTAISVEEMEKIMKSIEEGEGGAPVAAPVAPAAPAAAAPSSPLALREFVDPEQLKKDVQFNPNDLDDAVMNHASLFVYYADRARLARRQYEQMKAAFEIMESRLDAYWREKLKADGAKTTEAMIANAVKGDPRWWAAQKRLIDAKAIFDLANDAREAFMQRKDMIIQVSVDRRREKEGQLRILSEEQIAANRREALARAAEASQRASELTSA